MGWYASPGLFSACLIDWAVDEDCFCCKLWSSMPRHPVSSDLYYLPMKPLSFWYQWEGTFSLTRYMLKFEVSGFPYKLFNNLPFTFLLANFVRTKMITAIQICCQAWGSRISSLPSDRCLVWRLMLNIDQSPTVRLLTIIVQTVGI